MRGRARMWQMLLKGITEAQTATRPAAAAEMVLVRIAYVADLPTPDEAIRMLDQNGGSSPVIPGGTGPRAMPASPVTGSGGSLPPTGGARAMPVARSETSARPQMI